MIRYIVAYIMARFAWAIVSGLAVIIIGVATGAFQ